MLIWKFIFFMSTWDRFNSKTFEIINYGHSMGYDNETHGRPTDAILVPCFLQTLHDKWIDKCRTRRESYAREHSGTRRHGSRWRMLCIQRGAKSIKNANNMLAFIPFYFDRRELILSRIVRATYAAHNRNHTLAPMWLPMRCWFMNVLDSCNVIGLKAAICVKRVLKKKREKMKSSAAVNGGAVRSYFSIERVIAPNRPLSRCIMCMRDRAMFQRLIGENGNVWILVGNRVNLIAALLPLPAESVCIACDCIWRKTRFIWHIFECTAVALGIGCVPFSSQRNHVCAESPEQPYSLHLFPTIWTHIQSVTCIQCVLMALLYKVFIARCGPLTETSHITPTVVHCYSLALLANISIASEHQSEHNTSASKRFIPSCQNYYWNTIINSTK